MAGSRGVSKGLVAGVVAVVLLAAVVTGWFWLRQHASSQDSSAHTGCVEGSSTLAVTVDPDIAAEIRAAADRYNATKPTVRDHCVTVTVTPQPSAAVVAAFAAGWDQKLGAQPALWIPDSSRSIESMRVPGLIQGTPAPVAVSPIVLAVPDQLRQALESAKVSWSDLPRLQQGSLSELGLSGWGGLRMAMPAGDGSLAAALAVGSAVSGSDPLTDDTARAGQVTSAIARLAAGAPQTADNSAALTTAAGATAANAAVHATAATEQQLPGTGLTAYHPTGAEPVADHPAALLTGPWVDKTQNLVAGLFVDYLRAPDQQKLFADAGFPALPAGPPPVTAKPVLDQVRAVLAKPVLGVQSTVLIDTSAAMAVKDGVLTRLGNTLGALQSTMDVMPADFGLGVWTYSDVGAGQEGDGGAGTAYQVQGTTAPLTPAHRTELAKSLSTVSPDEVKNDRAYATLEAAYKNAVKNYADGHTNTILLITGGPNDDSAISGTQLLSDIAALTDSAHPIRIDVIVVGGKGSPTLQTLAQQSNGSYTKLTSSDDLKFGTAISQALTTS
ncbi:hypothetical protein NRB56_18220 [Nocardia sp. RB56]|uniref:VWFA domain-containing protein n=2 Tax=Nocardia aurantia TaxID=2585199 RepID=A0A7K0DKM2_9NOCA|nr:hypothetical protein [Nocardia aurantia]